SCRGSDAGRPLAQTLYSIGNSPRSVAVWPPFIDRRKTMTRARLHHLLCALIAAATFGGSSAAWGGPKAYVGNFKDNTVSVVHTDAATVLATLPVAAGPHGMAMTPDGRRLYVSGDGSSPLSVIDPTSDRVLGPIDVGKTPHGLVMLPDGKQLLVGVY